MRGTRINERRQGHSYPLPFFCLLHGWKWELAQIKKTILIEKGKLNISANKGGTTTLSQVDKEAGHNTQKELAKELNWSTGKVAMARRSAVFSKGSF